MKIEKVKKLLANLHDKTEYVIQIRNLKPALNHGLVSKKVHRVNKFNQNVWLKTIYLYEYWFKRESKKGFKKKKKKLINNAVFGKNMESVRKHRDTTLFTTENRRNYLMSEPNYHTTKFFTENLLAIEMKKKQSYL